MSEDNGQSAPDIFSILEIPVVLTYDGLGITDPITFYLRPFLHREEQDLRQAHSALTDAERKKAQHAYNVELLARLSTRAPEGLPGYNGNGNGSAEGIRDLLKEDAPMKVKVAEDAITRYYTATQPSEFFRRV